MIVARRYYMNSLVPTVLPHLHWYIRGSATFCQLRNLTVSLQWCHNDHDGISNNQPHDFPHKWSVTRKMFPFDDVIMFGAAAVEIGAGGRFKNTYELLNQRALKFSYVNKIHIFQCMGKIFCVEFQRYPLKFHTKYLTHTLKDMIFMQFWNFKSS